MKTGREDQRDGEVDGGQTHLCQKKHDAGFWEETQEQTSTPKPSHSGFFFFFVPYRLFGQKGKSYELKRLKGGRERVDGGVCLQGSHRNCWFPW